MRTTPLSRRYAEAAFDVATQDGDVQTWLRDLDRAVSELQDRSAARIFNDPSVANHEKMEVLEDLFQNSQPHVMNLLKLLAVRDRLHLLPAILQDMQDLDRTARGITEAYVTVARPLSDTEIGDIAERLGQATGNTIEIHTEVDPSIIGGVIVRIGDRLIDASVAGRLERLRHDLAV